MDDVKSNFNSNGYCIFSNVFSEKEINLVINELYRIRDKKKKGWKKTDNIRKKTSSKREAW